MGDYTLPKLVKVACFDIKVVEWEQHRANAARRWGEFSAGEMEIRIDTSTDKYQLLNTFLHEVNHAIYWAYGIHDKDEEERIVEIMSTGIMQVYRDNPEVLSFICGIVQPQPIFFGVDMAEDFDIDIDKLKPGNVVVAAKDE